MLIIIQILFVLLNVGIAEYRHELIEHKKQFKGNLNILLYILLASTVAFLNSSTLLFVCLILIRLTVFDIAFNLLREMPVFHVPRTSTSLIDKIHSKLFGNRSELYIPFYAFLLLTFNILMLC